MKKTFHIILIFLAFFTFLSILIYPNFTFVLGVITILVSLAFALYSISQKHKASQNPRLKIGKDVLILVFTIVLVSFLSGVVGLLINHYVSISFGAVAGLICAILVGFVIGYLVKKLITNFQT